MQHVLGGTIYRQTKHIMESKEDSKSTDEERNQLKFTWTETPQPLKDIVESSGLPCIVKMWREKDSEESPLDIHKPLLLYKEQNDIKVYCKNVTSVDVLTGAVCKEDPIVVIPMDYKGMSSDLSPISCIFK